MYIASGLFDMEGERQVLHEEILPAIAKKCVPLRIKVAFVDMRVGLSEHTFWTLVEREGMMPILAEMDRCEPFFLGLYGEKYGKRIHDYKIDDAMVRFEQYTRRIDDVEGRIEAYDLGLPKDLNHEFASLEAEESVQKEFDELKQRVAARTDREAG